MMMEHCSKAGSTVQFTTPNYRLVTTPRLEWAVVVDGETSLPEDHMLHGCTLRPIDELTKIDVAVKAGLTRVEVIALVLYTGPMYAIYNPILRRYPVEIYERFRDGDNLFTTTISVLVSAVQKVARSVPIPEGTKLYRGLGGLMDLPDSFFHGDEDGCKGFTEWAFMSTTANKEVALQYSGAQLGRPKAMVMVIEPNAVDRGACIKDFSQYPVEVEYLWLPCSFVQPMGDVSLAIVPQGVVTLVPVRVNANLKTETVEQLVDRKKTTHLTAFRTAIDDLKRELEEISKSDEAEARLERDPSRLQERNQTVPDLVNSILAQCHTVLSRHQQQPSSKFADDAMFRALVCEMLDVHAWGKQKMASWLHDPSAMICFVQLESLRLCHRQYLGYLKQSILTATDDDVKRGLALDFLKAKGLIQSRVDETNEAGEVVIISASADGWTAEDMQVLIIAGGDVNTTHVDNMTPMLCAARLGHLECLRELLQLGLTLIGVEMMARHPYC